MIIPIARVAAKQAFRPATLTRSIVSKAPFTTALKRQTPADDRHVPVTSYTQGSRSQEKVPVAEDVVVNPEGADDVKAAIPLNAKVMDQLTPTMKNFTLFGKVAIVTGYVRRDAKGQS